MRLNYEDFMNRIVDDVQFRTVSLFS